MFMLGNRKTSFMYATPRGTAKNSAKEGLFIFALFALWVLWSYIEIAAFHWHPILAIPVSAVLASLTMIVGLMVWCDPKK